MRSLAYLSVVLVCLACQSTTASAAIVLGFGVAGAPPDVTVNEVSANINDLVVVDVYAIQRVGDGRLDATGMQSFDFRADYNTGLGNVEDAAVNIVRSFTPPATFVFNFNFQPIMDFATPGTLRLAGANLDGGVPVEGVSVQGESFIRLGQISYRVTGAGITTFTLDDPQPAATNVNNTLQGGGNLDPEFFPSIRPMFRINSAVAIPEPSSVAVLAGIGVIGAVCVRRRKKARQI